MEFIVEKSRPMSTTRLRKPTMISKTGTQPKHKSSSQNMVFKTEQIKKLYGNKISSNNK